MQDLYGLIDRIKKAPSMYLGQHSIICLQAFLSGYSVAKYTGGQEITEQDRDFMEFPEWIREKFNIKTSQSWANIILFYSEDERKALDKFFELFAEFIHRHSGENVFNESRVKLANIGDSDRCSRQEQTID